MRITTMMSYNNAVNSLNNAVCDIQKYQTQLFTGKKVLKASDDPISMVSILNNRRELGNIEQYHKNVSTVRSTLGTAEGALTELKDIILRCSELIIQGSNSTYGDDSREAIAKEIMELKKQVGLLANTKYGDYYLFGGVDTKTPPYNAATGKWQANPDANIPLEIEVSLSTNVDINMNGEEIFNGAGVSDNIFDLLDNVIDDLMKGDVTSLSENRIPQMSNVINQISSSISKIGSNINRLDIVEAKNKEFELNAKEDLSDKEDADIQELYISLTTAKSIYNAGIAVTSKILQTSLIDYLR